MAKISISDRSDKTLGGKSIQQFPVRIRVKIFEVIAKILEEVEKVGDYIEVIKVAPNPLEGTEAEETNFIHVDVVMALSPYLSSKQARNFDCFFHESGDPLMIGEVILKKNILHSINECLTEAKKIHEAQTDCLFTLVGLMGNLKFYLTKAKGEN